VKEGLSRTGEQTQDMYANKMLQDELKAERLSAVTYKASRKVEKNNQKKEIRELKKQLADVTQKLSKSQDDSSTDWQLK